MCRMFSSLEFLPVITFTNGTEFVHLLLKEPKEPIAFSVVVLSTQDLLKLCFLMLKLNFSLLFIALIELSVS